MLSVSKNGAGNGTITSSHASINCGTDCTGDYSPGTTVTLTPVPDTGAVFAGWSGDPDCSDGVVNMNSAKSCVAIFNSTQWTIETIDIDGCVGSDSSIATDPS